MFSEHIKAFGAHIVARLKHKETPVTSPYLLPWVFYGWLATVTLAILILGSTLFLLHQTVYTTIEQVDTVIQTQALALPDINLRLFEKALERWEAKKRLPVKRTLPRNPFQHVSSPESPSAAAPR